MRKKILFNVVMLALILAVIFSSIMVIGAFGDIFKTPNTYSIVVNDITGSVTAERRGIDYLLKDGVSFAKDDIVKTSVNASAELKVDGKSLITISESSQLKISECSSGDTCIAPQKGKIFIETGNFSPTDQFDIDIKDTIISTDADSVISVEAYEGTQTINVYKGSVGVAFSDESETVSVGRQVVFLQDDDGISSVSYGPIEAVKLSNFLIEKILSVNQNYFEEDDLHRIVDARREETQAAIAAQKEHEAEILAQGGTVAVIESTENQEPDMPSFSSYVDICTVQIRCDTILDNINQLKSGKEQSVPEDGMILNAVSVEFLQGESVYDILKRACVSQNIPLSYRWTVEYGGYYIEGINDLYEFDCGNGSGWMYKVNGWYPNYACSDYLVKDGDVIVWSYTCDLGSDLGCDFE